MRPAFRTFAILILLVAGNVAARAADNAAFTRTEDVIYGRKYGVALTLDVLTPKEHANGAGIIFCVSGGWVSDHNNISGLADRGMFNEFLKRGYTVFAVCHGCQPKFTVPEIAQDMHRALRFIHAHAKDYKVDPERLGITGASAGGHLSLLMGTSGGPGDPKARDPIDRESSRVQAVACFFPASDFNNWGEKDHLLCPTTMQPQFRAALDYHELDKEKRLFERVSDEKQCRAIATKISPITYVSKDSPPTLILHGDADTLVPIQQAQIFVERMKEHGAGAELIVRKGAGHGWATLINDLSLCADWFDKNLVGKKAAN
jgi:acetyl esterase/lipase